MLQTLLLDNTELQSREGETCHVSSEPRHRNRVGTEFCGTNTKEDLLSDEQLAATGFWRFEDHPTEGRIRLTDPPVRFDKTPSSIRRFQPRLGEHSVEILAEAGYSDDDIARFLEKGVTGTSD